MAATFRPVNHNLIAQTIKEDPTAPSSSSALTSRPNTAPHSQYFAVMTPYDAAATPTRASFAGQKPLPTSPFPQAVQLPDPAERLRSDNSVKSSTRDSVDVDMDDSDADDAGSDDDSVNADGFRSSRKKKSQRFYCTDYPPCNLSFTRSEHLARHIR